MARLWRRLFWLAMGFLAISTMWNSIDIILRRWWWDQIPSQVNAPFVYGLLVLNIVFMGLLVFVSFGRRTSKVNLRKRIL